MNENIIKLDFLGKIIIRGEIKVISGLRIGGPTTGLKIGGIDQPVISDAGGKPYIPGSSLKGKMRSLIEKKEGVILNQTRKEMQKTDGGEREIEIPFSHMCDTEENYKNCAICKIWGILGSEKIKKVYILTRLIVRDVLLDENSITEEMRKNLELEWTEIKPETAIDRYKGTALKGSLRNIERVPAGAKFSPMEMIYSVYEDNDKNILVKLFEAMELLEHDYLGGMGSRGYGKIQFEDIKIYWNSRKNYEEGNLNENLIYQNNSVAEIVKNFEKEILSKLND